MSQALDELQRLTEAIASTDVVQGKARDARGAIVEKFKKLREQFEAGTQQPLFDFLKQFMWWCVACFPCSPLLNCFD